MPRTDLNDITAFLAVAREGSFTNAAAKLGVTQSALSQTVRNLEGRLGLRLLTRTIRNIAPTEAGERIIQAVGPKLDEVDAELAALTALRDKPAGTVRLSAGEHAADLILWPAVHKLLPHYPDINVEIIIDNGLTDIVAERLDAGVRLGEQVAKDMVAVRIGPDLRMAEQVLYAQARSLVGDRDPRSQEFTIQLRAIDADKSGGGLGVPVLAALCGSVLGRNSRGGTIIVGSATIGGSVEMLP
jgi:DNA-binding transcriptional LysR family regulator